MKKEKIILSVVALGIGLVAAGIIFYFYESSKKIPTTKIKKIAVIQPTPTPKPTVFLNISSPANELVTDKRILTVSGKTVADATILVLSATDETSGLASSDGDFTTTINLDDDQNVLKITAIAPNGETVTETRVVTFSTEDF